MQHKEDIEHNTSKLMLERKWLVKNKLKLVKSSHKISLLISQSKIL